MEMTFNLDGWNSNLGTRPCTNQHNLKKSYIFYVNVKQDRDLCYYAVNVQQNVSSVFKQSFNARRQSVAVSMLNQADGQNFLA